ncbi:hypothetical protein B0W47_01255 [Komagataeibacter nataicola]|uniref:Uncharacterized protein n=1 Tax=Komagataeibacter nataicola TaxID=265960 RepID=A0A9N7C653_9PROT|nr:hypothetical protein [Komagataeibacter nataicola]AQU86302.1 hypothetical protein B0W47_01255 [Komagataeibacter nataicola]PYD66541.1 hypothetical protein CDI09_07415 [Komagataeibacter nataicola]WEQ56820.1 hypothetical protein LV564_07040 [Komagataeibacter nataicola]WNM08286.1 hypothetical protein RI056_15600 [Komagataeibacter nataicola]GBR19078.1 hypothetical protein AA0616_1452 [Komagataeibacter nataicola NRIC 0616]
MTQGHDHLPAPEQERLALQIWQNAFHAAVLDLDEAQRAALLRRLGQFGQVMAQGREGASRVNTRAVREHALGVLAQVTQAARERVPRAHVPQWCHDAPDCD